MSEEVTDIAIACQGGGSHTAFTAGVLKRILGEPDPEIRIVGLSGASGGAMCALLAWYGLATAGNARAVELLDSFWADLAADSVVDSALNDLTVWWARLENVGVPLPAVSPYATAAAGIGQQRLHQTLEAHVDFERARRLADETTPTLLVSTVDVNDGEFKTVRAGQITPQAMLASAAVPNVFEAVKLDRTSPDLDADLYDGDHHWDGLFARNPPIREFLEIPETVEDKPDEIWIVQINPSAREDEPVWLEEIADRRNELAGNLSLEQEVDFIGQVNEWLTADPPKLSGEYKPVAVERIELRAELSPASKLDRGRSFVRQLMRRGEQEADRFLERRAGG